MGRPKAGSEGSFREFKLVAFYDPDKTHCHVVVMTDYPTFRQLGYDCGSGPTESLCGQPTQRLKGPGMRWDQDNAEAMTALASLYHSGQWDTYWRSVQAVA